MEFNIDITPIDNKNVSIPYFVKFVNEEIDKHVALIEKRYSKNDEDYKLYEEYRKIAFTTSNNTTYKIFLEEMVPLISFLQNPIANNYQRIKYMSGNQKGDAILDGKTKVEITKAKHSKDFIAVQDRLKYGYSLSPKKIKEKEDVTGDSPTQTDYYVYTDKEHVDDVVEYIQTALDMKKEKDYPEGSILIISFRADTMLASFDGDYSYLEQKIKNFNKGNFSVVFITDDCMTSKYDPNKTESKLESKWEFVL